MNSLLIPGDRPFPKERIGGKAYQLMQLREQGFRTPAFVVLETGFHQAFQQTQKLDRGAVRAAQTWMQSQPSTHFAVRSSAAGEDGFEHSFAGIFETRLNVTAQDLEENLAAVLRSSQHAVEKNYTAKAPLMAIIIQEMLEPRFAGVAFSRNPQGDSSLLRIEACDGLGTGVVDGSSEVTSYQLTREGQRLETEGAERLGSTDLQELHQQILRLEKIWRGPVDVEWAVTGAGIFILQTRPVTQSFPRLIYLTDANLSESYPGFTAPLSCDFVRQMYAHVFRDTARLLGATPRRILELWPFYQSLVREVSGHLYYDLESYAAAMKALPQGQKQFRDWLRLIGFNERVDLPEPRIQPLGFWETIKVLWRLLCLSWGQKKLSEDFLKRGQRRLQTLGQFAPNKSLAPLLQAHQIFDQIRVEFESPQDLAMGIFNDYFLMKLSPKNTLTASTLALESVRPQQELAKLARHLAVPGRREKLQALLAQDEISQLTETQLLQILRGFSHFFAREAELFLEIYGERAFGDLKLEHLSFRQDPSAFLQVLLQTAPFPGTGTEPPSVPPQVPRGRYERALYYRESCRLLRTRYFGWFRGQFLELARQMKAADIAWSKPEHLFYVRWPELLKWREGQMTGQELLHRADVRLLARSIHEDFPETLICADGEEERSLRARRHTTESQVFASDSSQGAFRGEVVSWPKGFDKIEGLLYFVTDPRRLPTDLDLKNSILVTETTDPAWVYLLSQCQGLVSFRGNALSHVAIIARELGKPMLVKARGAAKSFSNGDAVTMDKEGWIQLKK